MKKINVLLVEDNKGDAFLIEKMLNNVRDLTCRVTVRERLSDALEVLTLEQFALVLLDLTLPDSSGLETAVALYRAAPNTPLVILTGLEDQQMGIEAIRLGIQDYLSKNMLNSDTLGRTLRYALERHRLVNEQILLIQELDAFSHTVAHDLKNPLAIITGYASFIAEELKEHPDRDLTKSINEVVLHAQKMNSIVNELLLLAHVRRKEVDLYPVDMKKVVQNAVKQLKSTLDKAGAVVVIQEEWPAAMGYVPWLEEVWINYLSNAIKYGGHPPEIVLGSDPVVDGEVRCWVKDNGLGLRSEEIEQLFKPFTRLDQLRVDGHGLGLSIVHRIIQNLNGDVFVESNPGEGSCFGFVLPVAD